MKIQTNIAHVCDPGIDKAYCPMTKS